MKAEKKEVVVLTLTLKEAQTLKMIVEATTEAWSEEFKKDYSGEDMQSIGVLAIDLYEELAGIVE